MLSRVTGKTCFYQLVVLTKPQVRAQQGTWLAAPLLPADWEVAPAGGHALGL